MSGPPNFSTVTFTIDRDDQARRGRLGGLATHARYDSAVITRPAREAFERRFTTDDERRAYFAELGRRSGEARRLRSAGEGGAA